MNNLHLENKNLLTYNLNQIRTRITCSGDGREKSVKTAMQRHFRIDSKTWIRSQPGNFRARYIVLVCPEMLLKQKFEYLIFLVLNKNSD